LTQPIVNVAGLKIGLELGGDHVDGRLKNYVKHYDYVVDVHVVLGHQYPIAHANAIACHQEGVFVHSSSHTHQNSLVLSFHNYVGKESVCLGKVQDHGLIWWEASITQLAEEKADAALALVTANFEQMTIQTLKRKIEPNCRRCHSVHKH
jgi:hypothetical protein